MTSPSTLLLILLFTIITQKNNAGNKKGQLVKSCPFVLALPIFPGRRQPSIVGRNELNYRVRNGNGWTLVLISTNYVSRISPENIHTILFSSRFVKGFLVTRTGFEPMLTA